jgi:glutamate synthase (NADPH/NADH) small chain
MACAQQLARAGHSVTLFEKNDRMGGLLRYGIPDFKMEKQLINRRLQQMEAEGVEFRRPARKSACTSRSIRCVRILTRS